MSTSTIIFFVILGLCMLLSIVTLLNSVFVLGIYSILLGLKKILAYTIGLSDQEQRELTLLGIYEISIKSP